MWKYIGVLKPRVLIGKMLCDLGCKIHYASGENVGAVSSNGSPGNFWKTHFQQEHPEEYKEATLLSAHGSSIALTEIGGQTRLQSPLTVNPKLGKVAKEKIDREFVRMLVDHNLPSKLSRYEAFRS